MLHRAANYALDAVPEECHPEPFTAPALHLFGRQDDVVGYEDGLALRDHYPRGSFVVLDAAGHNVHLEQPDITAALVRDWLARIDRESRDHSDGAGTVSSMVLHRDAPIDTKTSTSSSVSVTYPFRLSRRRPDGC